MIDSNKAKLIQYLAIPKSLRPMSLKNFATKELGVSEPTVHHWKKLPEVRKKVDNLIKIRFSDDIPDVVEALKNNAIAGNVKAAQVFLDYVVGDELENTMQTKTMMPKEELNRTINELTRKFCPSNNIPV